MATLTAALVNDPVYGHLYKKMLDGGSWFDADQEFWMIRYDQTVPALTALLATKATKANVEKANAYLSVLEACCQNVVAHGKGPAVEALKARVKVWTPAPPSGPKAPARSTFAVLAETDDEDE